MLGSAAIATGRAPTVVQTIDDIGAVVPSKGDASNNDPETVADRVQSARRTAELRAYLSKPLPAAISRIVATARTIEITGTAGIGTSGQRLCELPVQAPAYGALDCASRRPVRVRDGTFTVSVPRFERSGRDRLFSRWLLVRCSKDCSGSSDVAWTTDTAAITAYSVEDTRPKTIKGIDDFSADTAAASAQIAAIGHVKINIRLDALFAHGDDGLPFVHNGRNYRFDRAAIAELDHRMQLARSLDRRVAAVLLIGREEGGILAHPDARMGPYAMANVATADGVAAYAAVLDLLASRYGDPASPRGWIAYWIVHNEVDAHRAWTHAGEKPEALYADLYMKSLRMVHLSVRKYDPVAKVFASFTHHWNSRPQRDHPANFKPRSLLGVMLALSRRQGDFDWGLAYHPYPEDLRDPTVWLDDPRVTPLHDDAAIISPRNLELIDSFLRRRSSLIDGERVRSLLFSENGMNSNGAINANAGEETQAAGIAYFWKKANGRLPTLEAIHLHRLVDHDREGRVAFGLLRNNSGKPLTDVAARKKSWEIWDAAGTSREDTVFSRYLPRTGMKSWSDAFLAIGSDVTPRTLTVVMPGGPAPSAVPTYIQVGRERRRWRGEDAVVFRSIASDTPLQVVLKQEGVILAASQIELSSDETISFTVAKP